MELKYVELKYVDFLAADIFVFAKIQVNRLSYIFARRKIQCFTLRKS